MLLRVFRISKTPVHFKRGFEMGGVGFVLGCAWAGCGVLPCAGFWVQGVRPLPDAKAPRPERPGGGGSPRRAFLSV